MRFVVLVILGFLATPAGADRIRKPSAPVRVYLDSKPVSGGYEVRLVAVPTHDVPTLELTLAGKTVGYGATIAGQRRELVTRVTVRAGEGLDVVGSAAAIGRNKASVLRLGSTRAHAPKRSTLRTLPDGRQIGEVR